MDENKRYNQELIKIGLTESEAIVYETLLNKGERIAGNLKRHLPHSISRPMLYFILDKLIEMNIVEKIDRKGKPTIFSAKSPKFLENILIQKQEEFEKTKNSFDVVIGKMLSQYNLLHNKPYVEFKEGLDGAKKIIEDTLTSSEDVYTFIDTDELEKYLSDINKEYVSKRKSKNIKKKILMVDSPLARKKALENSDSKTEIRIISSVNIPGFAATANIYDGKVSYITFKESKITATLIQDQEIYKLNRFVFESLWEKATS